MMERTSLRVERARRRVDGARDWLLERNPHWPGEFTLLVAIILGVASPDELTVAPRWVVPTGCSVLLIGLIIASPSHPTAESQPRRAVRMSLIGLVSAVNLLALFLLADALLSGSQQRGRPLLVGGAVLWLTTVLLFALWFWELDRGGPVRRLLQDDDSPDILFPPETAGDGLAPEDWQPGLDDYLYLSLTNAASFGPPEDTIPLTRRAKLLLSLQTLASLATLTIVLSYAVNNLN
jgi:hypothetical protein